MKKFLLTLLLSACLFANISNPAPDNIAEIGTSIIGRATNATLYVSVNGNNSNG